MTLPPDELQKMRDARRSALLAKWSAGVRLKPDERAEIADLIGESAPSAAPEPPPVAEQSAPASPALVLESPPSAAFSARSGCIHPLIPGTPYETTFDVTVRQIKRWRAAGAARESQMYPPLDEPGRMAEWYRVVMQRRVPRRLLELEEAAATEAKGQKNESPSTSSAPPQTAAASTPPPPVAPRAMPPATGAPTGATLSTGYAATLERLSQAEAIAAQRYAEAVVSIDPDVRAQAAGLKREWVDLADTVRAYERDRGKVLRESDAIWDKQAVLEAITSVHNVIAPGVRRLWRTIRRRHPQFHALTSTQQDEVFAREADALFSVLLNSHFTANTTPDPERPGAPDPEQQPAGDTASAAAPAAPQLAVA